MIPQKPGEISNCILKGLRWTWAALFSLVGAVMFFGSFFFWDLSPGEPGGGMTWEAIERLQDTPYEFWGSVLQLLLGLALMLLPLKLLLGKDKDSKNGMGSKETPRTFKLFVLKAMEWLLNLIASAIVGCVAAWFAFAWMAIRVQGSNVVTDEQCLLYFDNVVCIGTLAGCVLGLCLTKKVKRPVLSTLLVHVVGVLVFQLVPLRSWPQGLMIYSAGIVAGTTLVIALRRGKAGTRFVAP